MTSAQFYGWSRDYDWLDESLTPRRETWLTQRLRRMSRLTPDERASINEYFISHFTKFDRETNWFAGMALQGFVANPDTAKSSGKKVVAIIGPACYQLADAMLKAREGQK